MTDSSVTRGFTRVAGNIPAPALVLGGVCGIQFGAAFSPQIYPQVGAPGVVFLRLLIAGVLLCLVWRPRRQALDSVKGAWGTVIGAGALLAGHHLAFYEAVNHIPLGAVATIEFLGPFAIALAGSRRAVDLLPACLAAAGVLLLGGGGVPLDPGGLALAAVAACCWGGYILVSSRMARRLSGGQGLALAVLWAALLSTPYGLVRAGSAVLDPHVLWVAAVVAVASSVLPYSLNLEALRRIPPRVFGVLTSLEPAAGALFGLLILGQRLAWPQWLGIAAVACASVIATFLGAGGRRNSRVRAKSASPDAGQPALCETGPAR
ncbi:EamA family transporter [Streptomyces himastatinicus ATCC 53653]|uniref:EamA family transporter n=1 Tax=Streptomyces himastatinicus ATCC 53653 TaxID=457427 RepID=D9WMK3_9ACTN|nr:EamA family transporter [Streptomyces himastatinicus]EFL27869.1 EamA family transporter [Streptomyces himastatinicus ATCC 53653]